MEKTKKSKIHFIKEYIETCPYLDGDKIDVDYLKEDINSYSINQTPTNPIVEKYINGTSIKQIAFDFVVTAPISSKSIINLANSKFCEDFMEWVEAQNSKKIFPDIKGIFSIECTSPGYILQKTETTAIYIIQMNCKYYEY